MATAVSLLAGVLLAAIVLAAYQQWAMGVDLVRRFWCVFMAAYSFYTLSGE